MKELCKELAAEQQSLDNLVMPLAEEQWRQPVPFYNWTIYDEVAHICYFDDRSLLALQDRAAFASDAGVLLEQLSLNGSWPSLVDGRMGRMTGKELLTHWRATRTKMLDGLSEMDAKGRLPWYGPDMSARSFITARVMETWAHGQDVFDALRVRRINGDRLRHIAHIGVTTLGWSFINRGLSQPESSPRVELLSPSGNLWTWGEEAATDRVTGSAKDFCLVVTQRRHLRDTGLKVNGRLAEQWMAIAQCFAGPPANGPAPGARVVSYA